MFEIVWESPRFNMNLLFDSVKLLALKGVKLNSSKKHPAYWRQRISRPMWIVATIPKNPANKTKFVENSTFFARRYYTLHEQKHWFWDRFFPLVLPKDLENLKSLDIGLWEVGAQRRLNWVNKGRIKNPLKKNFGAAIFDHFWAKMFRSETTSFNYFSPMIPSL